MQIEIKSIDAQLINSSTNTESSCIISNWVVHYKISNPDHVIEGWLKWTAVPVAYKIIKYLQWYYGKRNTTTAEPA